MNYPVSNAMRRLLLRENVQSIGYGCGYWLVEIHDACFPHKRNVGNAEKWKTVLSAIDREKKNGCTMFEKGFFLTPSSRWARVFTLKDRQNLFNEVQNAD